MSIKKVTEQDSLYDNLENFSTTELINSIHNEDKKICSAIQKVLPLLSISMPQFFFIKFPRATPVI